MKVLLLADANSPHTVRWVKSLIAANVQVEIFTFYKIKFNLYDAINTLSTYSMNLDPIKQMKRDGFSKLVYLKAINKVKNIVKKTKPDIIHAHYASSYGLIGALVGFHPYIISVWGADVFNFPKYSFLHSRIIKFSLSRADTVLSTSIVMKNETRNYTDKEVIVTPFGIDLELFKPKKEVQQLNQNSLVIGTIKALEKKYGIEYLIKAVHVIQNKFPEKSVKLLIVGTGTQEKKLKQLVKELGLEKDTVFTGFVNHKEVPKYHNMIDIFVSASIDDSESFGVAILEASACEKPVIVSNVGGLPEVVVNGETGFVVEAKNPDAIAESISQLIVNSELKTKMGKNGRIRVIEKYDWNESVKKMISVYDSMILK